MLFLIQRNNFTVKTRNREALISNHTTYTKKTGLQKDNVEENLTLEESTRDKGAGHRVSTPIRLAWQHSLQLITRTLLGLA